MARAILQKGRGHPSIVMPTEGINRINQHRRQPERAAKQAQPAEPVEAKPVEAKPVEAKPTETQPKAPAEGQSATGLTAKVTIQRGAGRDVSAPPAAPLGAAPLGAAPLGAAPLGAVQINETPSLETDDTVLAAEKPHDQEPASIPLFDLFETELSVDDLQRLPGVGTALARRLRAAGFVSFREIAEGDGERLRRILGPRVEVIRAAAREAAR